MSILNKNNLNLKLNFRMKINSLKFTIFLFPFLAFSQNEIKKENLSQRDLIYWDFNKTKVQSAGCYYVDQYGETKEKHGEWKYYDKYGVLEEERSYYKGMLDGKVALYFANGQIKQEGYFKLDQQDSIYREWNENGTLAIEGKFEKNIQKGIWTYYYIDGRIKSHEKHEDDVNQVINFWLENREHTQTIKDGKGEMVTFHTTGTIKENYTYLNGLPNGPFTETSIYGYDLLTGNFKDGEKDGEWKYFYYTGDLEKISHYKNDKLEGSYLYYYYNGTVNVKGQYKNDKKDSLWEWFTNKGTPDMLGNFVEDLQDGEWNYWYPTGEKSYIAYFDRGLKTGEWTYWYKDGTVFKKGNFSNDLKDGPWKTWYEDGTLLMDGKYIEGKEEGVWLNYWENENLKNKATFKAGELNGSWKSYFPDGKIMIDGKYKNNFKTSRWTEFFSNGMTKKVMTYKVVEHKPVMNYGVTKDHKITESVRHGKYQSYSLKDFKLTEEGSYFKNKKHAQWKAYYPGGLIVAVETNYNKGELDGPMKEFTRRGEITTEINYAKGLKHGNFVIYGANKKIISKKVFSNGAQVR